jgi:hypothetical protein
MDSPLDEATLLAQLRAASGAIENVRAYLTSLEDGRRALLLQGEANGVPRPAMVAATGVTRGRIWQLLQPQVDDEDGESLAEQSALVGLLYEIAADNWDAAGRVGDLDDYFPLEARRRDS